ncbi:MAG: hypothetical protein Q9162_006978 [Coniocarpon cinnabarinum]
MPALVPAQHNRELRLFKCRLDEHHARLYLSLRNSILRLWTRNPLVAVTREEAAQCTKDRRYQALALIAHEWLAKHGYINFGCLEQPMIRGVPTPAQSWRQRTVVIIGGGVAGLSCARQLYGLFHQYVDQWARRKRERLPRILVLEGRNRVGGRIYSHPLRHQQPGSLPHGLSNTAELGAQIITGFDHGNPLDAVVRGQLALEYHLMTDNMTLYDYDGTIINEDQDTKMQDLFNDIMEVASEHPLSWKPAVKVPTSDGERTTLAAANEQAEPQKPYLFPGLANGIRPKLDADGDTHAPSLGSLMDELVAKFQRERNLTAKDLRILNWHFANLEYGNAVNVANLSLGGWDQDSGNEFEGQHSMVLGGYNQLVRGLLQQPFPMDVRSSQIVKEIQYTTDESIKQEGGSKGRVVCANGTSYDADHIVSTLPLGVLKYGDVSFQPPVPAWKRATLRRLGFGVLNKVVLVFPECFWPPERDMFGLCNQTTSVPNSLHQNHYSRHRGRFFLFWNCLKSTGRPMLTALMAGDSAFDTETSGPVSPYRTPTSLGHSSKASASGASTPLSSSPPPDTTEASLISSCTATLATMFRLPAPPKPVEAVITRWKSDPFSRGVYSYLGTDAQPGDYDSMAQRVGNLHFAGEATCGTHPATVHGAFISGLRAASEVIEQVLGPIDGTDALPPQL